MTADDRNDLRRRIDESELVRVCQDLLRFETVNPPGNERQAAQYVADYLSEAGLSTRLVPLDDARASVVARLHRGGDGPSLMFNGHLDVVPIGAQSWTHAPFAAEMADGRLWGRGACDMKGGLASMLVAAKALAASGMCLRGDLLVTATADEEVGMRGAKSLIADQGLGPLQGIVVGEPTNNTIALAERGALWVEISTHGKTAHGSMPELGHNAIIMMVAFLSELERLDLPFERHPILGGFTRSINTIDGGVKTNVVPDRCVTTVDMRTVPGQDHADIIRRMQDLIDNVAREQPDFRATLRVLYDLPSVEVSPEQSVVQRFAHVLTQVTGVEQEPHGVRFASEAGIYVPALGVPVIICGPGDPSLAHQPNEHVEIAQLVEAAELFALVAADLLA